jgi:exosome complex component RRP4
MVQPQKKLYKPEVGDVVIGRVISIEKKSWRVDFNYNRDGNLSLSSINLPQGEQVYHIYFFLIIF